MEKTGQFKISLEQFIDSFPEAIYAKDTQSGEIVLANKAYTRGTNLKSALGLKDEKFIKDKEELEFILKTEEGIKSKVKVAYDILEKITINGHTRLNSTTKAPLTDNKGKTTHILGISRDISGRFDHYKMLFHSFQGCCFISTKYGGGRWEEINKEGCRMFGWGNDIVNFKKRAKVIDFYENDDQRKNFISDIEEKGYVKNYDMRLKRKNGKLFDARVTASVRKNEETKEVIGFHGIIQDVTEQKEAERTLRRKLENLKSSLTKEIQEHIRIFLQDELIASMPSIGTLEEIDKKIYFLLIKRKTNKEIAEILDMNHRTVEHYRRRIYDELIINPKGGRRQLSNLLEFAKRNGHV